MNAGPLRGLCLAALLGATLAACSPEKGGATSRRPAEARPVATATATLQPMERLVTATGTLLAQEAATLSVKVAGRLHKLGVDLGSEVRQGDPIAQVEPRDYELRLQQAAAALAQARAYLGLPLEGEDDKIAPEATSPVRQAKAVLEEAAKNRERVLNLSRQGISSPAEVDTVEAAYTVALNRYEAAMDEARTRQAALAQRRAEYELARKQLADTTVRAPFDGAIQERIARLGEYTATGAPVVRIVKTDPLRLRLELPERNAAALRAGQRVRFTIEGGTNIHEVHLLRLSPALDDQSRMLIAEADVPNDGSLRPGSFVRAEIITDEGDQGIGVPADALVVFAGLEKVLVVRDGKAVERLVTTGRRGSHWVEIVSGLEPGETVILKPGSMQTGQAVTIEGVSTPPAQARVP